jgi:hypothetical protein
LYLPVLAGLALIVAGWVPLLAPTLLTPDGLLDVVVKIVASVVDPA